MKESKTSERSAYRLLRCSELLGHRLCVRNNRIKCLLCLFYAIMCASLGVVECNGSANQITEVGIKVVSNQKYLLLNGDSHLSITRTERLRLRSILLLANFGSQASHKISKVSDALLFGGFALVADSAPTAELGSHKAENEACKYWGDVFDKLTPILTMAAFVGGYCLNEWWQIRKHRKWLRHRWPNDRTLRQPPGATTAANKKPE